MALLSCACLAGGLQFEGMSMAHALLTTFLCEVPHGGETLRICYGLVLRGKARRQQRSTAARASEHLQWRSGREVRRVVVVVVVVEAVEWGVRDGFGGGKACVREGATHTPKA
jgi:hypothetical protein